MARQISEREQFEQDKRDVERMYAKRGAKGRIALRNLDKVADAYLGMKWVSDKVPFGQYLKNQGIERFV